MSEAVTGVADDVEVVGHTRAMATDITVRALRTEITESVLNDALCDALKVFGDMEQACTRFDPNSPLMQANAAPGMMRQVPPYCFDALSEAFRCYRETGGRFDPRILADLVALGYDRSLDFASGEVHVSSPRPARQRPLPRWRPRLRAKSLEVTLGSHPVDLGGIGKGLAVRWASLALAAAAPDHLIEAGGDCYCSGSAPGDEPWLIAVEDPFGYPTPRAVLALRDLACATSSIRLRHWIRNGERVHHLLDPRTGRPGGAGLRAVTVVMDDPAEAEVWAKVLFLAGRSDIAAMAERRSLAALWIDDSGSVNTSKSMGPFVCWGPR